MSGKEKALRIGGVGTGRIFQYGHIRSYPRIIDKARLVGFYDLDKDRAKQARDKTEQLLNEYAEANPQAAGSVKENIAELRVHDTLDSLLDSVDAIDICTHSRGRMPTAIAAFEKGVHVMAEKPMSRTWTEADRTARKLAECPGVFFQLNDDNVFSLKYRTLGDIVRTRLIGKPQTMTFVRGSALDGKTVLKAQANAMENGGGCMMDYGAHGLAGAWAAIGLNYKPVMVEAVSVDVLHRHRVLENEPFVMEVDDNARVKVLFKDESEKSWVTLYIEATWCGGHIGLTSGPDQRFYLQLVGDSGVVETSREPKLTVNHYDGGVTELPLREPEGEPISMYDGIETFVDCVRASRAPEIDIAFGSDIIAICGAAYLSAIEGRGISLDEFKQYCRGFVEKLGDDNSADDAILTELLTPYKAT